MQLALTLAMQGPSAKLEVQVWLLCRPNLSMPSHALA
jgi:hypothetical protein